MNFFSCSFILLICSFFSYAQSNPKLDSLNNVLAKLPKEGSSFGGDTMRVRVLIEIGKSQEIGNENGAMTDINKALHLSDKLNWTTGQIEADFQLGYLYASKYEYLRAIEYLYRSLYLAEKHKNKTYIAKNGRILGDCYSTLGDYSKAIRYLKMSILAFFELNMFEDYLISLNNLGLVYYESKDYKTASNYFLTCIEKNKIYNFKRRNTHFLTNLGASYIHLNDYKNALKYLNDADILQSQLENYPNLHRVLTNTYIAECWLNLRKYKLALTFLAKAEKFNAKNGSISSSKSMYDVYYQVYRKLGKDDLALKYYEKSMNVQEKLRAQDFDKQLKNVQYEYENQKKATQIVLLNKNIKQGQIINRVFIGGLILLLCFGLWFWWNNKQLTLKNNKIQKQQLEIQQINSQLEHLNKNLEIKVNERTKELSNANEELLKKNVEILTALVEGQTLERKRVATELHDNLGSMLSGMKFRLQALNKENLTPKEQKVYEGILTMMGDAYSEVRLISHNLLPAELEKSGLVGALQKLCNDINQSGKLSILLQTNDLQLNLDKKTELELYSICLELVNNILKHSGATEASINFYDNTKELLLIIKDNGIGIDLEKQNSGIGLKNIQNRIRTLSGYFEMHQNYTQGVVFTLRLPHLIHH